MIGCKGLQNINIQFGPRWERNIPVWVTNETENVKISYENVPFETTRVIACKLEETKLGEEAQKILEANDFRVINLHYNHITANKLLKVDDSEPRFLEIILKFGDIKFQHAVYKSQISISARVRKFEKSESKKIAENETQALFASFENICLNEIMTFLSTSSKQRNELTKSEEKIYERFGKEGLLILDLINGKNDLATIVKLSGLSEKQVLEILDYLATKNFIRIINK